VLLIVFCNSISAFEETIDCGLNILPSRKRSWKFLDVNLMFQQWTFTVCALAFLAFSCQFWVNPVNFLGKGRTSYSQQLPATKKDLEAPPHTGRRGAGRGEDPLKQALPFDLFPRKIFGRSSLTSSRRHISHRFPETQAKSSFSFAPVVRPKPRLYPGSIGLVFL